MSDRHVLRLEPGDPSHAASWNAFVTGRAESSSYHRMEWLRIIHEAFGHPVFALAIQYGGAIRGVLPLVLVTSRLFGRFLVSLPYVNYGGILVEDDSDRNALLRAAESIMTEKKAACVELRHCAPHFSALPAKQHKVCMLLALEENPDAQWHALKDKVRNQIRKARLNGLTVVEGGIELLNEFYTVFCINMRFLGTPVYSRRFFHTILTRLPKETSILCVRKGAQCIAAGILYASGRIAEMPWASSLPSSRHLCPNNLLYWETVSRCCARGHTAFDFGRSTPGSGPWRFKAQWGAIELPLHWEYLLAPGTRMPELNPQNPRFQLASGIWKHLPLAVTKILGPPIVRGIP